MGIGGDLPILLLECRDGKDLSLVQLLLKAHAWYRMHGLWVDLVLAVTRLRATDIRCANGSALWPSPATAMS